ncbi:MAG: hypothetical protein ACPG32_08475 [Akkermansiaceae bacterium]
MKIPPMEEEEFLIVRKQHIFSILFTIGVPVLLPVLALQFNWYFVLENFKISILLSAILSYGISRKIFPRAIRAYTWRYRHYKNGRGWRNGTTK